MSIFRRPDYQSDTTQFINQLKTQHPELDANKKAAPCCGTKNSALTSKPPSKPAVWRKNLTCTKPRPDLQTLGIDRSDEHHR